jgi:type II secretory pathway pseudopilin PulG
MRYLFATLRIKPKHTLLYAFLILIGLAIFVIVIAGAMFYFNHQNNNQRFSSTRICIQEIDKALQIYARQHNGKFPLTLSEITHDDCLGDGVLRDSWGTPFNYQSDGATFKIQSAGPDLKLNTEDDISN